MPTALVYYQGHSRIKELAGSLSDLNGWDVCFNARENFPIQKLLNDFQECELHFLIYANALDIDSLNELYFIRKSCPFTFIIYYNSYLVNQQFLKLSEAGINACIIGSQRQNYLQELLQKLWQKHWKRIPDKIYPNCPKSLSSRARKVLTFIENKTLNHCQVKNIARYLEISPSHLRAEFKYNFGINFREFKQKLFAHYESVLLFNQNYKPTDVYRLFPYSNPANLSRSFKNRHGESWRNMSH
jgi:AraC-like DNA-binding protein